MSDDWGTETREHTFSTGRTATLRKHVNVFAISTETAAMGNGESDPNLTFGEAFLAILQHIWIKPRVLDAGAEPENGAVAWEDLRTAEVAETIGIWTEEAANANTFRGDALSVGGGEGGEGVGAGSKPAPRARTRKSGSVHR